MIAGSLELTDWCDNLRHLNHTSDPSYTPLTVFLLRLIVKALRSAQIQPPSLILRRLLPLDLSPLPYPRVLSYHSLFCSPAQFLSCLIAVSLPLSPNPDDVLLCFLCHLFSASPAHEVNMSRHWLAAQTMWSYWSDLVGEVMGLLVSFQEGWPPRPVYTNLTASFGGDLKEIVSFDHCGCLMLNQSCWLPDILHTHKYLWDINLPLKFKPLVLIFAGEMIPIF